MTAMVIPTQYFSQRSQSPTIRTVSAQLTALVVRNFKKTSWTFSNPGRRFLICPKDRIRGCRYFKWVDASFLGEAKKVILELMDARSELYSYNAQVNAERLELKAVLEKLKVDHQRKVALLEGELLVARSKNLQVKWLKAVYVVLAVVIVATWVKVVV